MVVPLCDCVLISSSHKDTSHMGIGPTPVTSCNLIISIKTLSPNQSHSEVPVFRISTYEFGGGGGVHNSAHNTTEGQHSILPWGQRGRACGKAPPLCDLLLCLSSQQLCQPLQTWFGKVMHLPIMTFPYLPQGYLIRQLPFHHPQP